MNFKVKKQHYKNEAKNVELKQSRGFRLCQFAGVLGIKIKAYLMVFVVK